MSPDPRPAVPTDPADRIDAPLVQGLALVDPAPGIGAGPHPGHARRRRWDVGSHDGDIVAMPLLERAAAEHRGALHGVRVLYINHAISDSLMVARALRAVGGELVNVLIPYHGGREDNHAPLHRAFAAVGPTYAPAPQHPTRFAATMHQTVLQAIHQASAGGTGPWMIVEDGGYAFPALHDDPSLTGPLDTCIGAVEHTSRGRWNYEYLETDATPATPRMLRRPAVTISGSALKTAHEGAFVAQALVDECTWLLRRDHEFLRHRKTVVIGYGRVGRALASALHRTGAEVAVHDLDAIDLEPGLRRTDLATAITEGAFLVFGATGGSSFPCTALQTFLRDSTAPTLYLASASSKAVEFGDVIALLDRASHDPRTAADLAGPGATITAQHDPDIGLRYRIHAPSGPPGGHETRGGPVPRIKEVVVLGQGYPVIFYPPDTHGAPNRAMDPVMTQLFLAAAGLPAGAAPLPPRVHDLDALRALSSALLPTPWHDLLDEAGLLAAWCQANHLDWDTYRTRIGFTHGAGADQRTQR